MKIARRTVCVGGLTLLSTVAAAETIYRCESSGGIVYSDRPCAADATVHEVDGSRVTVYNAPPISKHASQPRSKASTPRRSARKAVAADAKHQAACAKLEQSLREVQTRLRTGYGVKESASRHAGTSWPSGGARKSAVNDCDAYTCAARRERIMSPSGASRAAGTWVQTIRRSTDGGKVRGSSCLLSRVAWD